MNPIQLLSPDGVSRPGFSTVVAGQHLIFVPDENSVELWINGKLLGLIDLFYFTSEWKDEVDAEQAVKSNAPQICLYTGEWGADTLATCQWRTNGKIEICIDRPRRFLQIDPSDYMLQATYTVPEDETEDEAAE